MKKNLLFLTFVVMACGGSLSDDQRKKIKEDMASHRIVKITDAEITEAAFKQGRNILTKINSAGKNFKADSLSLSTNSKIKWVVPGAANAMEVENQLIEAYITSSVNGGGEDNIQRIGTDSLLYTKPVTEKLPDGSENVKGMWSIRLSKKEVILSMNK